MKVSAAHPSPANSAQEMEGLIALTPRYGQTKGQAIAHSFSSPSFLLRVITDKNCESALCSGKALGYPETHLDYLDRQTDRQGLEEGILPNEPGASTPTLYLVYDLESTAHLYGPEKERLGLHALEVPVQNSAKTSLRTEVETSKHSPTESWSSD